MRLIDADELLKKKVLVYSCFNDEAEGILVKDIEETLTINPEDLRPKGKLLKDGDFFICLNCENEINEKNSLGEENKRNYCPCCRAKMEE